MVLELSMCQQCVAHKHACLELYYNAIQSGSVYQRLLDAHESRFVRTNAVVLRSASAQGYISPGIATQLQAEAVVELRDRSCRCSRLPNDNESSCRTAQYDKDVTPLETSGGKVSETYANEMQGSGVVCQRLKHPFRRYPRQTESAWTAVAIME